MYDPLEALMGGRLELYILERCETHIEFMASAAQMTSADRNVCKTKPNDKRRSVANFAEQSVEDPKLKHCPSLHINMKLTNSLPHEVVLIATRLSL